MKTTRDLAVAYVAARDEVARLKKERAECMCEHEAPRDDDREPIAEGDYRHAKVPDKEYREPCWKMVYEQPESEDGHTITSGGWVHSVPPDAWCESCKRRQVIHGQLKAAHLRVNARLGALISHTRALKRSTP